MRLRAVRLIRLFVTSIVCVTSLSGIAQHTYYFADQYYKDADGSKKRPYASLNKMSEIVLSAGDTVFLHANDIFRGIIQLQNLHGTKTKPVVITTNGIGKAIINSDEEEAINFSNCSYIKIINLQFIGAGRRNGNTTNGINISNSSGITLYKLDVSGFQKAGLFLYNVKDIEVDSIYAHDNGESGILVEGDYQQRISKNIHIINCFAENNAGDPTNLTNHSGNGILVGNCRNVLIEYCTATNNGWDMPRTGNGPVGIWCYEADSVVIQHCISYKNKTAYGASDGGGFDLDGGTTNSVIQYCLSYENQGSGYGIYQYYGAGKWNNNNVRYCISINDGKITENASAMYIWNGWNGDSTFTNFYAYNNFFYNDEKYAFSFSPLSAHKKFSFYNNVFIAADTADMYYGDDSSNSDIYLGNTWMHVHGGFKQQNFSALQAWANSTGYETRNEKFTGCSFQQSLFVLPKHLNITNPHDLQTNNILLTLCNNMLNKKGINLQDEKILNNPATDFFGNKITALNNATPGICVLK